MTSQSATIPLSSEAQLARLKFRQQTTCPELWEVLDAVKDPEIPVLSIWDLGVLQSVKRTEEKIEVVITPTYSGCPAMREIESDILSALGKAGHKTVEVLTRLAPAWSTDWMSSAGRARLREYGIAPPLAPGSSSKICCPRCASDNTSKISEFGSTPCKALYQCADCLEPFDYFKCI